MQRKIILNQALKLPSVERAQLIEDILESFEFGARDKIDMVWALEAEKRIDAYNEKRIKKISAKQVFKKINNS